MDYFFLNPRAITSFSEVFIKTTKMILYHPDFPTTRPNVIKSNIYEESEATIGTFVRIS